MQFGAKKLKILLKLTIQNLQLKIMGRLISFGTMEDGMLIMEKMPMLPGFGHQLN